MARAERQLFPAIVPGGPATPWAADFGIDLTFHGRARSARPTDEHRYLFSTPPTEPLRPSSGDGASAPVRVPSERHVPRALIAAAIAEAKH